MKLIDRYIVRETLGPFLMALGLFTFLLQVKPMLDQAQGLLAKGVDLPTVGFLLVTLLPQALGITIPMAFLAGLLMGLGRLSGDREAVALLACGVSPLRLLRSVLILGVLAGAVDMYVLTSLVPNANQRFREITFRLLVRRSEGDIKPGVFYQGFPGKVLYVREARPGGGWSGVMLADTSQPGRAPIVTLAESGYLAINEARREVEIVLPGSSIRYLPGDEGVYDTARAQDLRFAVPADTVFGDGNTAVQRGLAEMTIADLRKAEAAKRAAGLSPHNEIMHRHQMVSFPVACLVFSLLGLALGLHTRKEGKLGGFTLGIGVVFLYYSVMAIAESMTKGGHFPAEWSRWVPNILLGAAGVIAVAWRVRTSRGELTLEMPAVVQRFLARRRPAASARSRTVSVVIRIPRITLPRPRLLDLYVARRYMGVLLLAFLGLLGLYYIGTFIDKSERLFKGQADTWMILKYFYYSTPQFVAYVVPMATLVAVLATIGGLTRTSELVVIRACGVSLYRIAVPLMLFAMLWSGGLFLLDDRVLAASSRKADDLDTLIRGGKPQEIAPITGATWIADRKGRLVYYYTMYDMATETLRGLSVFETASSPFRLISHTQVATATFAKNAWKGHDGWVEHFPATVGGPSKRETFAQRTLGLAAPQYFSSLHNQETDLMTFTELRRHINEMSESGFSLADSRVRLQERVAFPLVTLVMTLLGVPFGITTGRRGALYGFGLALILGASYWLIDTFFLAVGRADLLPPLLAAWAANIFFLCAATYLTLTVKT